MSRKKRNKGGNALPDVDVTAMDLPDAVAQTDDFPNDFAVDTSLFGEFGSMDIQHGPDGQPYVVLDNNQPQPEPVQALFNDDGSPIVPDTVVINDQPAQQSAQRPVQQSAQQPIQQPTPQPASEPVRPSAEPVSQQDAPVSAPPRYDDLDDVLAQDEPKGLVKFWNAAFDRIDDFKQKHAAKKAANATRKAARAEATANADNGDRESVADRFKKLKAAFAKGHDEAVTDPETGKPSKAKQVLSFCGKCAGTALLWSGTKVAHMSSSFVKGAKAAWDARAERHGRDASDTITRRFTDDAILSAADKVTDDDVRLRQALDVVHKHGYITAGGAEFMQDLAEVDRLKKRGYQVTMPATVSDVAIPGAAKDKLNITVRINDYDGSSGGIEPVSQDAAVDSIADSIRRDLGDGAKRGQSALVDDTVTAMAHIRAGYDALQKIADSPDLPDEFKKFLKDTMPKWSEQLEAQDKQVGARIRSAAGMDTPVVDPKRVAAAAAITPDEPDDDDVAFDVADE